MRSIRAALAALSLVVAGIVGARAAEPSPGIPIMPGCVGEFVGNGSSTNPATCVDLLGTNQTIHGNWTFLGNLTSPFTQNGTGAIPTTIQTKLRQVELSVDDFYTSSQGTYDTAFAAAIAAAPLSGATIDLQPGTTYTVNNPIAVNRGNILFNCKGYQTCTVASNSTTGDNFSVNVGTTVTTTISTTLNSTAATVANSSGLVVGQEIASANIPVGAAILAVSGNNITLSTNSTATASGTSAVFGNYLFNIYFQNIVYSKNNVSTAGCFIDVANAAFVGIFNNYFFGNFHAWNSVCVTSSGMLTMNNNYSNSPLAQPVTLTGLSAAQGTLNGTVTNVFAYANIYSGGNSAFGSPLNHGLVEMGDYTNGLAFVNEEGEGHGYMYDFIGASPSHGNGLIYIINPDEEADFAGASGFLHSVNYSNFMLTNGWVTGFGTPTINWDTGSTQLQATGVEIVENNGGTTVPAVSCTGTNLVLTGNIIQSYATGQGIGVQSQPGCSGLNITGGRIEQFLTGVANNGASSFQISVNGVQFGLNTTDIDPTLQAFSGYTGFGNSNASGPLTNIGPRYAGGGGQFVITATGQSVPASQGTTQSTWQINAADGTGAYSVGRSAANNNAHDFFIEDIVNNLPIATYSAAAGWSFPALIASVGSVASGSSPTLTTGSCSGSAAVGGRLAGKFTAALCAAGTYIISGLPTAPNGYTCGAWDQTTPADALVQTGNSPTSATLKATTAASDVVAFSCQGW